MEKQDGAEYPPRRTSVICVPDVRHALAANMGAKWMRLGWRRRARTTGESSLRFGNTAKSLTISSDQPSSGQGGSMALEDCEALALFLQHHLEQDEKAGHITASKQYFELRQQRVTMVHKKAQETGALKQDMGFVKEMMMYFFIWLISKFAPNTSLN